MSNFVQAVSRNGRSSVFDVDKIVYVETSDQDQSDSFYSFGKYVLYIYLLSGKHGYVVEYFNSAETRLERIKTLTGVDCK